MATVAVCTWAYSGEMSGSRPEPDEVTASAGTFDSGTPYVSETHCLRSFTALTRSVLVAPRLEAPETWRSYWVFTPLVLLLPSPAEGRGWKNFRSGTGLPFLSLPLS